MKDNTQNTAVATPPRTGFDSLNSDEWKQLGDGISGATGALEGFKASGRTDATPVALPHQFRTIAGTNIPDAETVVFDPTTLVAEIADGSTSSGAPRTIIQALNIDGVRMKYSERFAESFCGLLGQGKSVFNLFGVDEVVNRAIERKALRDALLKVTYVTDHQGERHALAVVRDKAPIMSGQAFAESLAASRINPNNVAFDYGKVTSLHDPAVAHKFLVGVDELTSKFVLNTPIDGYGSASSYLAVVRMICVNLNIWYTKAFRSSVNLGEAEVQQALERFLATFNNEEGFISVAEALSQAHTTPASVNDIMDVSNVIDQVAGYDKDDKEHIFRSGVKSVLGAMARGGEDGMPLWQRYGKPNLNEEPKKVLQRLAAYCSVYDLINFSTEFASHHVSNEHSRRMINSRIAEKISDKNGFDLAGFDFPPGYDATKDPTSHWITPGLN